MIEIECSYRAGIGRFDCYDYVRAVTFDVFGRDANGDRFRIGNMNADQVLVFDAVNDGEPLLHVFDADSQGLCDAFEALFKNDGELQGELGIDDFTHQLTFLWDATFHPVLEPFVPAIIETTASLAGMNSLFAMWHSITGLTDAQLAELGFSSIAGSELIFRHSAYSTPFSRENPRGVEVPLEFVVGREHEEWLNKNYSEERF